MNLRKEQVLFVVTLLLAAWIWSGRTDATISRRVAPGEKEFALGATPVVVLADADSPVPAERDLFREPTEATPLPPRDLPFPPLAPLPIVAPPLDPGQHPTAWHQLRMPGGEPVQHQFAEREEPAVASGEPVPANGGGEDARIPEEVMVERFDRVRVKGQWFFGNVLNENKLDLVGAGPFNVPIRFEWVSRSNGKVVAREEYEPDEVEEIQVAQNLRNEVALKKRELPQGAAGVAPREKFLDFLIEKARENDWVWQEAEEQARILFAETTEKGAQPEIGYRALLRVHRAQGDLAGELAIYRSLTGEAAELPARWREQGRFEARLGLLEDAEAHLRTAVELGPSDARNTAALASFLLERGRASEAVPYAERALHGIGQVTEDRQKFEVGEAVVATLLAVGRVDDAFSALSRAGGTPAQRAYLTGAVEYARGNLAAARDQFQRAAEGLESMDVVLGLGAVALREGRWDDARQLLERVRDEAPALRGRALAALGLLFERTGWPEDARVQLERAERVAPRDPYVLYLLGRRQRLDGEFEAAVATLRRALSERDEMEIALAETAYALLGRAAESDLESPELLARTVRYVDRLVVLDAERGNHVPFLDLQGHVLAAVGDVAQARRAFVKGQAAGSAFSELGLAILDYRQKRTTEARDALARLMGDAERPPWVSAFARATLDLIDDHASKEQVRDSFSRDALGELWDAQVGPTRPIIEDGRLLIRGATGPTGQASGARRTVRLGDLLSVGVEMTVLGNLATSDFAGLRLQPTDRRAASTFMVKLGVTGYGQAKRPEIVVVDGRSDEAVKPVQLDVDFEVGQPIRLKLELVPTGEDSGKAVLLRASWNDRIVHEQPLKSVRAGGNSSTEIATELIAAGRPVQVAFDDYRLVRRKDNR